MTALLVWFLMMKMKARMKAERREEIALYVLSAFVRIVMIVYGHWQDKYQEVKYTDVDYLVFTDAARFMSQGGSPYQRATYRYTPLLALLLWPTTLHPAPPLLRTVAFAWGKLLFSACDLLVGYLISTILSDAFPAWVARKGPRRRLLLVSLWLLNPVVVNVSSRGSADSIVAVMVLATVALVLRGRYVSAGLMHGLSVHFKLYPLIYSITYLVALAPPSTRHSLRATLRGLFTKAPLAFAFTSAGSFLLLTFLCAVSYPEDYLHHGLLYHLSRTDHRHNYSMYFYPIYLSFHSGSRVWLGLGALVPQAVLLLWMSLSLGRDLPAAVALQTLVFVTFNKVCTGQYFLWYLSIFPAALPSLHSPPPSLLSCWLLSLLSWLGCAYLLEFRGLNTFGATYAASTAFFGVNVALAAHLLATHTPPAPSRLKSK